MCLSFQKHKNKIKVGACCFDIFCLLVEIREDTVWTGLIATPFRVCAQTPVCTSCLRTLSRGVAQKRSRRFHISRPVAPVEMTERNTREDLRTHLRQKLSWR